VVFLTQGCSTDLMTECVRELLELGCDDMTVCGNNCASYSGLIPKGSIILPVNNYGQNYLKASA
jgi:hypothetical protein